MDLKESKNKLKRVIHFDLRTWEKVQKAIDSNKYGQLYKYIREYDYLYTNICLSGVREKIPYRENQIVSYPRLYDAEFARHEVLYQILCAELYFILISIEKTDSTCNAYYNSSEGYYVKKQILKRCWIFVNSLFENYYESVNKHGMIPSTQISSTFNSICLELKQYLELRDDFDKRNIEQKVVDTTKSILENIVLHVLFIMSAMIVILLMAKCCGADVRPFG